MRLWKSFSPARSSRPATQPRAARFRPTLLGLEDRTVPAADMFADAFDLTGMFGDDTGSNVGATGEPGEVNLDPNAGSGDEGGTQAAIHSLWWKYTAQQDGLVEVNTAGSDFDTILGVYADTDGTIAGLTQVAVNDDADASTPQSRVVFQATADTTYYFAVDGKSDATGSLRLRVGEIPPPNDNFASAAVHYGGADFAHNMGATAEAGEPGGAVNSVWWRWTAAQSGPATIDTFGSGFDTVLSVYTGGELGSLNLVGSGNGAGGTAVSFDAVAGTTYAISVAGYNGEYGAIFLHAPPALVPSSNSAPVMADQTFSVNENVAAGTVVGTVSASDPDAGQALTYSIVGGNTSGAFTIDAATGRITVASAAAMNYEANPTFTLTVRVADNGDPALSTAATVTIRLNDVNDAPVLDNSGTMSLGGISSGQTNNPGTLVADLLASAGGNRVTDQDAGALRGIAIVAADTSHGSWQFSTNGGATWANLGAVSNGSARLLAADANTRVRFVPSLLYSGTVTNALTFRASDQTSGVNGGLANTGAGGGSSAFSTATETASIRVKLLGLL